MAKALRTKVAISKHNKLKNPLRHFFFRIYIADCFFAN